MIKVNLEIADTPFTRSQGLMGRRQLDKDSGMIFMFPRKLSQSFWMQNTYVPLDIAFLDDDGTIFQIEQMSPLSTRLTKSIKDCKFAVEMNSGWFSKNNIDVGFQMFKGDEWVKDLKIKAASRSMIRIAQVDVENEELVMEPNQFDAVLTPEQEQGLSEEPPVEENIVQEPPGGQEIPDQQTQPDPVIQNNMNMMSTIQYAQANNLPLDIVYWTLSGHVLPPRKLVPIPGEGYPIKSGPNGRYFVGYDSSPSIQGGDWEIKGGTPKNFLIDNVISLEIPTNEGERPNEVEQTIEQPQNLWDRIKKLFNR